MTNPALTLRPAVPGLLASGLLFWGWQNGYLAYAIIMALVLEASHLVSRRMTLTDRDFNRIADISSIVFLLTILVVFNEKAAHGIYTLLSLLPFLFFPLLLGQVYSSAGKIKPSALFISLRKLQNTGVDNEPDAVDLTLPYLFLCLIAASAGNHHEQAFFLGVCLLVSWALWLMRPRRYYRAIQIFMLLLAFSLAYTGQLGIRNLQAMAESTFLEWFDRFMWRSRDPDRTSTAIGTLGKLKLSDRIMVRVETDKPLNEPLLLREATYTNYSYGVWTNYNKTLLPIDPELNAREWRINESRGDTHNARISFHMDDKTSVIPVPQGVTRVIARGATQLEASPYGIIRLEKLPGWTRYRTDFVNEPAFDAEPGSAELAIPSTYREDLKRIARRLGLKETSPEESIRILGNWFADNFTYSLNQRHRYPRGRHLSKFLLEHRSGHCEFFATATALLLRTSNIPTRYVVGYSVQEYSPLEGQYIARASYAHSWVQAWVNGRWQVIDNTPAVWAPLEEENRALVEPLVDLWSWLTYRFSMRDDDSIESNDRSYIMVVLVVALMALLAWRLWRDPRQQAKRGNLHAATDIRKQGLDSGFYPLLEKLERDLPPRKPGETLPAWLERTEDPGIVKQLRDILTLHYRYRFDPEVIQQETRTRIDRAVKQFQESY